MEANTENESKITIRLEKLFLKRNTLEPRQLIEAFENIVYGKYDTEWDNVLANKIFEWYEDPFPGDDEEEREEIESLKIHAFLKSLVYGLDDGYFSLDEEEE